MLYIQRDQTDPYFNIAAEEYFLKEFEEDIFTLWQNEPSIIVGKHQNAFAEINAEFVKENNIPVIRRISGGGTVYHDHGNLNFTFVHNIISNELINFRRFLDPVIDALRNIGIDARFVGKNDLKIGMMKISGNAQHIHKKRVLHHGTLLFSSKLSDLNNAFNTGPTFYADKAIRSVKSSVCNIGGYMDHPLSVAEFKEKVRDLLLKQFKQVINYDLTHEDFHGIEKLVNEKYATWEWNYGYSPDFNFKKAYHLNESTFDLDVNVSRGIIQSVSISGEFPGDKFVEKISQLLLGRQFDASFFRHLPLNLIS